MPVLVGQLVDRHEHDPLEDPNLLGKHPHLIRVTGIIQFGQVSMQGSGDIRDPEAFVKRKPGHPVGRPVVELYPLPRALVRMPGDPHAWLLLKAQRFFRRAAFWALRFVRRLFEAALSPGAARFTQGGIRPAKRSIPSPVPIPRPPRSAAAAAKVTRSINEDFAMGSFYQSCQAAPVRVTLWEMKKVKPSKPNLPSAAQRNLTGLVYYWPTVGRFVIYEAGGVRIYDRTTIMRHNFRPKSVCVAGELTRAIAEVHSNPFAVFLGTVENFGAYSINGMGEYRKLRTREIKELMALLEQNISKIQTKGPVKVKEFNLTFEHKGYEFEVESYVDRKTFLSQCPEFKKFKPKRTRVSEYWIERKKLKPEMTVVKTKVI